MNMSATVTESTSLPQREAQHHAVTFTGNGREYFGIWIVNVLLSIVTLGIYSAWAKVRRMQYFARNTQIDGASFDYHGDPKAILKGRLIAFALFAIYQFAGIAHPFLGVGVAIVLAGVMPALLLRSLRFRLYNLSYRGLRFHFTGTTVCSRRPNPGCVGENEAARTVKEAIFDPSSGVESGHGRRFVKADEISALRRVPARAPVSANRSAASFSR